jgi:hypothetical protein
VAKGVKALVVISAGFAETGAEGPVGTITAAGWTAYAPEDEAFELKTYGSEEEARQAIRDREIDGVMSPEKPLVASAASFPVAQLIRGEIRDAEDVVPLDSDDPRGVSLNLLILPLSITSILGAMLLFQLAPKLPPPVRLAGLGIFALLGGIIAALIVNLAIGAVPGNFLAIAGISALGIAATATAASGLIAMIGPPAIGLSFLIFLMIGNPASGMASAPELLPDPWRVGGQFLPAGAAGSALRNVAYFDGAAITRPLIVLAAFVAIGAALLFIASARSTPPGTAPQAA